MKIGILSDLHLESAPQWGFKPEKDTLYLCAGDIHTDGYVRKMFIEKHKHHMLAINGNHDYWGSNVDALMRGTIYQEINGLKIAGATLWTHVINPLTWIDIKEGMNDSFFIEGFEQEAINAVHMAHREFLFNSGADVIFTHHAPSALSIDEDFKYSNINQAYYTELYHLILELPKPPKLWIHGHMHRKKDYMIGDTRVICHPRGYIHEREVHKNYRPLIVEIDL